MAQDDAPETQRSAGPDDAASPAPLKVLLGVSGGIAAYKTPALVRAFIARGHEVQVVMTDAAAAFVTELSLSVVSKRPVRRALLDASEEGNVGHIELADWPDVVVVAPATANVLARASHGFADDLLTTILLATRAPVVWAPAMNTNMWRHAATRRNLEVLGQRGATFVGPDRGDLACGWVGEGRMIDPPLIVAGVEARMYAAKTGSARPEPKVEDARGDGGVQAALEVVDDVAEGPDAPARDTGDAETMDWRGRHVVVSAGPTRAYIDPVRFISNASTGSMGYEIARAARARGARVTLVSGPVGLEVPEGVRRVDVETADQMLEAMTRVLERDDVDLVAMVAAVADLAPDSPADRKLDKAAVESALSDMRWKKEVDVLAALVERFGDGVRFLGFAAQTVEADDPTVVEETLLKYAREKLDRKRADAIFVNRVGVRGLGFASATNAGYLMLRRPDAGIEVIGSGEPMQKSALARWLVAALDRELLAPDPTPKGHAR